MRAIALAAVAALAAGCAAVTTYVTPFDPARTLTPSERTVILLEHPQRPYTALALIEARGLADGTEGELLEAARREGARIGADAVVRLGVDSTYTPPFVVYDSFYPPYYWGRPLYYGGYRYGYVHPYYYGGHRFVGGGTTLTLQALAIKYDPER